MTWMSGVSAMRLADHTLDLHAGTLHDASGVIVSMRPQAWAVLAVLARHAGQVVTKDQLLDTVWPGLVVTEGSIAQAISDVRAALGSAGHTLVKSVPRRGYVLVVGSSDLASQASHNVPELPASAGPLFGRDSELRALLDMLTTHRLVTLLGAGGIGKTVLALAAAHAFVADHPGQAAWVDLARITEATLLPTTLAHALALPSSHSDDPLRGLLAALRPLDTWVVLDNAEHLIGPVATIATAMLAAAPHVRLLVTSQAPLHIDTERLFRVSALDVPAAGTKASEAGGVGSVALFVDRAAAVDRSYRLTDDNVDAVVRLCRRLDGLPLAIKLAAGRVHVLGLASLEMHLDDRLQWLGAEQRDAPSRQQTLLAALQWSYGLLSAPEQKLYRRLGVFVGGFTAELAVAVGRDSSEDAPPIAQLQGLVERSLVDTQPGEPPRFRLLESQREQAMRELMREGEIDDAQRRHARALTETMFAASEAHWHTADAEWMTTWSPELDNVRAALKWSALHVPSWSASLVGSASGMFRLLDAGSELQRVAATLDRGAIADMDANAAARFWVARSYLETDVPMSHACALEGEHCARMAGNSLLLFLALCQRMTSTYVPIDEGDALLTEIGALESPIWSARVRCQRWLADYTLNSLRGRWREALKAAETGYALAIKAGATLPIAAFGNGILVALLSSGKVDEAVDRSGELRDRILPGPASMVIPFIGTTARLWLMKGDLSASREHLATLFALCRAVEWSRFDIFAHVYFMLAFAERRYETAARLLGFSGVATPRAWGMPRFAQKREKSRAELAAILDPQRLNALLAEGAGLGQEEVCRLTLEG